MAPSGKPVKTSATNSSSAKTASKKKNAVLSPAVVVDEDNSAVAVENPTVETASATDSSSEQTESEDAKKQLVDVSSLIGQLKEDFAASIAGMKLIFSRVRELEKAHNKEKRAKGSRKRKSPESDTPVEPKPEKLFEIEEPLREFLGTPLGEKVGKKAARKAISVYINDNKLQDPEDHTLIKPDEKLGNLFGIPRFVTTKGRHGYSNLNALRYIQNYFIVPKVEEVPPLQEVPVSV